MEVSQASAQLTLFAEASRNRAKICPTPERAPASLASARDYGASTPVLLAKLDPATSSWKTSQLCLVEGLATFSQTWPRSGLMRSGIAYQLPPLDCRTNAIECGLLPTVTVCGNYNRVGASATSGDGVATAVKRLTGFFPAAEFCEVLMGFPPGWTALSAPAMPLRRKSQNSSGAQSRKRRG